MARGLLFSTVRGAGKGPAGMRLANLPVSCVDAGDRGELACVEASVDLIALAVAGRAERIGHVIAELRRRKRTVRRAIAWLETLAPDYSPPPKSNPAGACRILQMPGPASSVPATPNGIATPGEP